MIERENGESTLLNDGYLFSLYTFLQFNNDCSRLRTRQKWFATKKGDQAPITTSLLETVKSSIKEFQGSLLAKGEHACYI